MDEILQQNPRILAFGGKNLVRKFQVLNFSQFFMYNCTWKNLSLECRPVFRIGVAASRLKNTVNSKDRVVFW